MSKNKDLWLYESKAAGLFFVLFYSCAACDTPLSANAVSRRRGVAAPTAERVSERLAYSLFEILRFTDILRF